MKPRPMRAVLLAAIEYIIFATIPQKPLAQLPLIALLVFVVAFIFARLSAYRLISKFGCTENFSTRSTELETIAPRRMLTLRSLIQGNSNSFVKKIILIQMFLLDLFLYDLMHLYPWKARQKALLPPILALARCLFSEGVYEGTFEALEAGYQEEIEDALRAGDTELANSLHKEMLKDFSRAFMRQAWASIGKWFGGLAKRIIR